MHFPIAIVESSFSTYGFLNVYSSTELVPERTLALVREWGARLRNPDPDSLQEVIDLLHNEYLSHSYSKYVGVKDPIGWHLAFCMLSLALFSDDRCWLVHLGDHTVARIEEGNLVRIAPIHDIRHEYAERTLDEAGLPALMNLTPEMAEIIVGLRPGTLSQLQGKTSGELAERLGDFNTRVIGDHYGELLAKNRKTDVEMTSRKAYITSFPLAKELSLIMLEHSPHSLSALLDEQVPVKRTVRLELESKWSPEKIEEIRVAGTTPLTSQNLGLKIQWQEGKQVEVFALALKP